MVYPSPTFKLHPSIYWIKAIAKTFLVVKHPDSLAFQILSNKIRNSQRVWIRGGQTPSAATAKPSSRDHSSCGVRESAHEPAASLPDSGHGTRSYITIKKLYSRCIASSLSCTGVGSVKLNYRYPKSRFIAGKWKINVTRNRTARGTASDGVRPRGQSIARERRDITDNNSFPKTWSFFFCRIERQRMTLWNNTHQSDTVPWLQYK